MNKFKSMPQAVQIETQESGVSQVMDSKRLVELPLNGRQVTDLIVISGAATVSATTSFPRNYPSINISVAGGMHNALTYLLDGATHNDPINGLNLPLPFPDALQEFKLENSSLFAQYGQHYAGAVNAVTKSGTNAFHAGLFEFFRHGCMNALNYFAVVPDQLKRNQYGGTIGGPIRKNKPFSAHRCVPFKDRAGGAVATQFVRRGKSSWARANDYHGRWRLTICAQNSSDFATPGKARRLCPSDNPNI